jgi:hypothetical protein
MGEQRNRWNWEVSGFEPRKTTSDDHMPGAPLVRRYSISAASALAHSELTKPSVASKVQRLNDKVKVSSFYFISSIFLFFLLWLDIYCLVMVFYL